MTNLLKVLFVALLLCQGCQPRKSAQDPDGTTQSLSWCAILYDDVTGEWLRAIQPIDNNKFVLCRENEPLAVEPIQHDTLCQLSEFVNVEGYEETQRFELLEDYCIDDPISGRCEVWNCQGLHDEADIEDQWAYAPGCFALPNRHAGTCDDMWNE